MTWPKSCVCRSWRPLGWMHDRFPTQRQSAHERPETHRMSRTTMKRPASARTGLPVPTRHLPPRVKVGARPHGLAPGELVKLHHSLAESLNTGTGVVCQFIAPESSAGTEDVVYDLAYISAAWLGKRVLFINAAGMKLDPK